MNRGFALGFIFGTIAGGLTAYFVLKARGEQEFEFEEFDPEEYRERKAREKEEKPEPIQEDYINPRKLAESNLNKPSIMDYAEKIRKEGYRDYAGEQRTEEKIEVNKSIKEAKMVEASKLIEYISPDEFGEIEDYAKTTWIYFADGVLADDAEEAVNDTDISNTVGLEFADHFGEFEPDAVHVRNDDIEEYFEILKDERTFDEFLKTRPEEPQVRREDE